MSSWVTAQSAASLGAATSAQFNSHYQLLQFLAGDPTYAGTQRDRFYVYDTAGGGSLGTAGGGFQFTAEGGYAVDQANGHSTTTNTSRYVAQTSGLFLASGVLAATCTAIGAAANNWIACWLSLNGAAVPGSYDRAYLTAAALTTATTPEVFVEMTAGQYLELYVQVGTGLTSPTTVVSGAAASSFTVELRSQT